MGQRVDTSYLLYEVGEASCRTTIEGMDNPLLPVPISKPQRVSRSEVDRFASDLIKAIDTIALLFWEYINRNDARMDQFEEALRRKK